MNLQENIQRIRERMNLMEEETNGGLLYQLTSTNRGVMIIGSDKLIAGKTPYLQLNYDEKLKNTKTQKAISFTTNNDWIPKQIESLGVGSSDSLGNLDIKFVLSKDRLQQDYEIETFNFDDILPSFLRDGFSEYEERVLTDEISPLSKYVVDIVYKGDDIEVQNLIDKYLNK